MAAETVANRKMITILVPCYNEEAGLEALVNAVKTGLVDADISQRYDFELLLVNDGSRDNSQAVMKALREKHIFVNYLNLSRNFGKENAMLAGMDYSRGDAVVIMDADLQQPVEVIPAMIEKWEEGYDDVYGISPKRPKESWLRRFLSVNYYRVLKRMSRVDTLPNVGDFRLLDRNCVEAACSLRETERNTKAIIAWIGFNKAAVEFQKVESMRRSRFSIGSLLHLAIDGITSFTTAPLRFATVMGMMVSFVSFLYMIFVFVRTLIYGDPVKGYPSLAILILFLGGCQLLALGIIGEYIGKIFKETKRRPPYIAESLNGEKISGNKNER